MSKTKMFYWIGILFFALPTLSSAIDWINNTNWRVAAMGGINLVVEDQDTHLSLFNLENPAGLMFELQQSRLDFSIARNHRSENSQTIDEIALLQPGRHWHGITYWINPEFVMQFGEQLFFQNIESTSSDFKHAHKTDGIANLKMVWEMYPQLSFGASMRFHHQIQGIYLNDYEATSDPFVQWTLAAGYEIPQIVGEGSQLILGLVAGNQDEDNDINWHTVDQRYDDYFWDFFSFDINGSDRLKTTVDYAAKSRRFSSQVLLLTDSGLEAGVVIDYVDRQSLIIDETVHRITRIYNPTNAGPGYIDTDIDVDELDSKEKELGLSAIVRWVMPTSENNNTIIGVRYTTLGSHITDINTKHYSRDELFDYSSGVTTVTESESESSALSKAFSQNLAIGFGLQGLKKRLQGGLQIEGNYTHHYYENSYSYYNDDDYYTHNVKINLGLEYQPVSYFRIRLGGSGHVHSETHNSGRFNESLALELDQVNLILGLGIGKPEDFTVDLIYKDTIINSNDTNKVDLLGAQINIPL